MVTRFGMSDEVGLMSVGDSEQEIFLGRELVQRREVSEHTAELVDREVKRILDEAHARATTVLGEHEDLLEAIALALLDRETLGRVDIELLEQGKPLPPLALPGEDVPGEEAAEEEKAESEGGESEHVPWATERGTTMRSDDEVDVRADGEDALTAGEAEEEPVTTPAARIGSEEPETES